MKSLHPLDSAILLIYLVGIVASGVWLSRRASKNLDSYFLGGKQIHWFFLGISNASSMFDATGTMATVAWLFTYGLKSLWLPWIWPTFNQIFLMVFLAAWLRRSNVLTGAEWLRTRFGSGLGLQLAHISVVIYAVVAVVAFIAYAFVGVGKFASLILPWEFSENTYATGLMTITAVYVIFGGMYSVVLTDAVQFLLLTVASIAVAWIAIVATTPEQISAATPAGWENFWPTWRIDLDWTGKIDALNQRIATEGYELFTPLLMMVFCKGIIASIAGPAPGYDMQRVLAARNPREACLMSGVVSPVLYLPRFLLVAGITVLALVFFSNQLQAQGDNADFEKILPGVIQQFIPVGLTGLLLAGLFAAFMSTFDSSLNSGAAYLVNDVYRRYLRPKASARELVNISYVASIVILIAGIVCGLAASTINSSLQWIAGGLFGGYAAPNLLKWIWWRLNGAGYFAGMLTGVILALCFSKLSLLVLVPLLLFASGAVSILVSLATPADDSQVLAAFYKQVRPWGFWGPILATVRTDDLEFRPNRDFARDMTNCAVGIVWQLSLCAAPIYFVLRNWPATLTSLGIIVLTTVFLKLNWYDHLGKQPQS